MRLTLVVVALILSATTVSLAAGQGETTIGIDAVPDGNTATSLGVIDDCRRVELNDSFEIDVFVQDVPGLVGFQFFLNYDPDVLRVTGSDVQLLLAANEGSSVVDFSEDGPGQYIVAAADFGSQGAEEDESGSGVLARLTVEAIGEGVTRTFLSEIVLQRTASGNIPVAVEPADDAGNFLGPAFPANIAVGQICTPPVEQDDTDSGSTTAVLIAAGIGLAITAVVIGTGAFVWKRRRGAA